LNDVKNNTLLPHRYISQPSTTPLTLPYPILHNYLLNNTTNINSDFIAFGNIKMIKNLIVTSPRFKIGNPPSSNNNCGLAALRDLIGTNYNNIRNQCKLSQGTQLTGDELGNILTGFNDRIALMVINAEYYQVNGRYYQINGDYIITGYSLEIYYRGNINAINKIAIIMNDEIMRHYIRVFKKDNSEITPMDIINEIRKYTNEYDRVRNMFGTFHMTAQTITDNIINQ